MGYLFRAPYYILTVANVGFTHTSKFDVAVQTKERMLRKALIAYIGTASDFTETDITLVLSPVMTTPRQTEPTTRLMGMVASFLGPTGY